MLALAAPAQVLAGKWQILAPSSSIRQEVSYVEAGGKLYLAGGGALHERYDPKTNSWSTVKPLPAQRDHIQGVELGGKIYYIGGLSGWPKPHASTVYVYNPTTNTFSQGAPMPEGRGRGAGGVAAYNGKIYYAGGLHNGGAVPWFDVYDPQTDSWSQLPNMPRAKDHFHAAVVGGKFYAIGGRNSSISLNATIPKVDVYDLTGGTGGFWQTPNADLPTPRGGFAAAVLGQEILVIGGEGGGKAYNTVEAYNTASNSWRTLAPLPTARHGIQAAVCDGGVYVAAGGTRQGGGGATNKHEVFFLGAPTTCGSIQDTTAPKVNTVSPANLTTGVARGTNATATFSEQMAPASITKSTFKLFKCASTTSTSCTSQLTNVTVSLSTDGLRATLNPYGTSSTLLTSRTKYKAVVTTGAKDLAGNALDQNATTTGNQQKQWYFTTGG